MEEVMDGAPISAIVKGMTASTRFGVWYDAAMQGCALPLGNPARPMSLSNGGRVAYLYGGTLRFASGAGIKRRS
jgi:hypothetical protein